jgi:hypothetical protein
MTRPEIRAHLHALPLREPRHILTVSVTRTRLGWSVEGGGAVSIETATNLVDSLIRIRESRCVE